MNKNDKDRAFLNMRRDAVNMLKGKDPETITKNAGVTYNSELNCFLLPSLGKTYTITCPDYRIREEIYHWHYLTIEDAVAVGGYLLQRLTC